MYKHHRFPALFLVAVFSLSSPAKTFAVESESNREAIVTPRTKKFYKVERARQYLSFGASYTSDYNSKNYELTSRYLYQSSKFINEINFEHQNNYADSGSGKNKKYAVKKSELYDLTLSSKARFGETRNYAVFFHRDIYDDLSKYYYDTRTAVGLGRMFFNEKLEFDISAGYHDVKTYGNDFEVVASMRANFKLSEKLTFVQRGYWFFDHESIDNGLKTSLVYRLSDKMSFEVRHNFETRRYEADEKRVTENYVNRSVILGLIFDLN